MQMKTFTYIGLILSGTSACATVVEPTDSAVAPDVGTTMDPVVATGGMDAGSGGTTAVTPAGTGGMMIIPAGGGGTPAQLPDPEPMGPVKNCIASGAPGDVLLEDDFEDGAATWFPNNEIFWELVQDETQAYQQQYAADELNVAAGGCSEWADVLVEAKVKMTGGTDSDDIAAVFVRLKDASNFYYVALQGDGRLKIKKRVDGSNNSIGTTYGEQTLAQNVWHTIGIEAVGPQLNMYVDGVLIDSVDDPGKWSAVDTDLTSGLAGFGTFGNATAVFDDIKITQR